MSESKMKFYAIEYDREDYDVSSGTWIKNRGYYMSSKSKSVDPTNIKYAKLFPTVRSAKSAWVNPTQNPIYYEVEVDIKIIRSVDL
jgi:hypothetical protein